MSNLKNFLELASKLYYQGNPIISDVQYDALEEKFGELKKPGYNPGTGISHYYPLYSLKKYYDGEDDLPDWVEGGGTIKTPKLDGAVVSILYINGWTTQVLTRGDGEKGVDINHLPIANIDYSKSLAPHYLKDVPPILQISGEIVAPKTLDNARNIAAGATNLKDPNEFLSRDLTFVAHDTYPNLEETYSKTCTTLEVLGFRTVLGSGLDIFPTDGEVYRINNYARFFSLGYTSKYPRGAFALKQRTEGQPTKLLDVIWQTGKSGKVTPVAILAPINIDGATVTRATLNNVGFIEALDIEIGDYVMVERSGGIIPRIIKKAELTEDNAEQLKNNS